MNLIETIEREQIAKLTGQRPVPDFAPGDTLKVNVKVVEGERTRVQAFEGVCIGRKNAGLHSAFTVRKISYGEGVERVFPLYSPNISSIEVLRKGAVRRAKLYYLRGRTGKKARIAEKAGAYTLTEADVATLTPEQEAARAAAAAEAAARKKEKKAAAEKKDKKPAKKKERTDAR